MPTNDSLLPSLETSTEWNPFQGPHKTIERWNFQLLTAIMFLITTLSIVENFIVIVVTFKFKQLRQPLNYIIVNLSVADFLVSIVGGSISIATNSRGYFFLGSWACVVEGFAVTFFGKVWGFFIHTIMLTGSNSCLGLLIIKVHLSLPNFVRYHCLFYWPDKCIEFCHFTHT